MSAIVGREDLPPTDYNSMGEYIRWIGKPWRRVEKMWHTHTWKGETERTDVTYTLALGLRRIGLHFNLSVTYSPTLDYSDEPNQ